MDDNSFAFQHPPDDGITAVCAVYPYRHGTLAVGVAGAHNCDRKPFFPVQLHQEFFPGNFVPGIFPVRVSKRGTLADAVIRSRFLVSGG